MNAAANPATAGGVGVPRHIAIIMDGNGRWAKARHLPRIAGHRKGAEAVRTTIRAAVELGVECLTLYAFSSENWRRPADEVSDLKGLLRSVISNELDDLAKGGVCLKIIGDYSRFGQDLSTMLERAMERTAANRRLTLVIALNYGAQNEIARAARALAADVQTGQLAVDAIDEDMLAARLDTADLPPLDLLIRTSGEKRLSNFLLWQAAYAELLFVDTLWPDFGREALASAIADFARRERRYGGL